MVTINKEQRAVTTVADPALQKPDALAELQVELYNRPNETSAAGALGINFVETPDGNPYPIVVVNNQGTGVSLAEGTANRETGSPSFTRTYLGAHRYVSSVPVSSEMVSDNYIMSFMDELATLLADSTSRVIDPLVFNGTGTSQPRGFLQDLPTITVGANPNHEQLFAASLSLNSARYREKERLRWGMHRDVYARIYAQGFSNAAGPVGTGTSAAFSDDAPLMLWGYPVVLCNDMPNGTSNGTRIAVFGDFGRAVSARRVMTVGASDLSPAAFANDEYELRHVSRVDSRVTDSSAARALVIG